jgi:hypothetical protein
VLDLVSGGRVGLSGNQEDSSMGKQFEYRVCQVQNTRVTFVNGSPPEAKPSDTSQREQLLTVGPTVWEYLQQAGTEGWELVAALDSAHDESSLDVGMGGVGHYQVLYLKREKFVGRY